MHTRRKIAKGVKGLKLANDFIKFYCKRLAKLRKTKKHKQKQEGNTKGENITQRKQKRKKKVQLPPRRGLLTGNYSGRKLLSTGTSVMALSTTRNTPPNVRHRCFQRDATKLRLVLHTALIAAVGYSLSTSNWQSSGSELFRYLMRASKPPRARICMGVPPCSITR